MSDERPSERLVLQRIRNRIIEYLEVTSSFERQRLEAVPPAETINQWEDWVQPEWLSAYRPLVFTPEEHEAILVFHAAWDAVADATPDPLPSLNELLLSGAWGRLRTAAQEALAVFAPRGKLPEDREATE